MAAGGVMAVARIAGGAVAPTYLVCDSGECETRPGCAERREILEMPYAESGLRWWRLHCRRMADHPFLRWRRRAVAVVARHGGSGGSGGTAAARSRRAFAIMAAASAMRPPETASAGMAGRLPPVVVFARNTAACWGGGMVGRLVSFGWVEAVQLVA